MRALSRVLAILEAVAGSDSGLTTTQVAAQVGLSAPTASRLVRDMAVEQLLDRGVSDGVYRLGPRIKAIGLMSSEHGLTERARPVMERLTALTGETCSLHVRAGDRRICIVEVQGSHAIRRVIPVGTSLPLHVGVTGEVLLTGFTAPELNEYLEHLGLRTDELAALVNRIGTIRREGWGTAVNQWEQGLAGLAAPIRDGEAVLASLSISGPSTRWTPLRMEGFAEEIRRAAEGLSPPS